MRNFFISAVLVLLLISCDNKTSTKNATTATENSNYKEDVKRQFQEYTRLLVQKEYDKAAEFINPKLFKLLPKDQMIELMEKTFNDPEVEMTFDPPKNITVGEIKTINNIHYAKITYEDVLHMRMKSKDVTEQDTGFMKSTLAGKFGEDNVSYDLKTGRYVILAKHDAIAESADQKNWTFLTIEEEQKSQLEKIFPKELLR
jgi:hypothetical protein